MSTLFESVDRKTTKEMKERVRLVHAWGSKAGLVDAKEKFQTTPTSLAFGEFAGQYTGSQLTEIWKRTNQDAEEYFMLRDFVKTAYCLALGRCY